MSCYALVGLFTRCFGFRRDVCLRRTLGCHAPFRCSWSREEEEETHITCEPPINRFYIQHYRSIPSHLLLTRCIDISQPISTPFTPPRLDSLPTNKAPPALNHFIPERHTATFACLDTGPYAFHTYIHIFTMAAMNASTAPSTVQGSKPSAPANGNVIKRYIHTIIPSPPS